MAKHPPERSGVSLRVRHRPVGFSFWPMRRGTRRFGLQSRVFASEPWNVIERAVNEDCPPTAKKLALAYFEQSRDFFLAAKVGGIRAAKPLLIYYSFMNLVKAFGLTKGLVTSYGDHHHGLTADFSAGAGPVGVKLVAYPTGTKVNLFDLLYRRLNGPGLSAKTTFELDRVLPQILLGHRLWCDAADSTERFIEIKSLDFRDSKRRKEAWLRFDILRTEYIRLGYTQKKVLVGARLAALWETVSPKPKDDQLLRLQSKLPKPYTGRPSDIINGVVDAVKYCFWRSITITPPFRKYYIYVAEQSDVLLPQICSIYMVFFYLGSITRYRPDQFDELIAGPYGAFLQEFIENQPNQWLYMLASEFAEQEVTRAAVV